MKSKILITILLVLSLGIGALGEDKVITAACDPWPPFINPQSSSEGISMEIIRAAYKTQGYKVQLEYVPWARAERGVRAGKYDILPPTWKTSSREKIYLFTDPYAYNEIKFIKQKGDDFEYEGLESLTGKKIGTIRGYGYGDKFLEATNFEREEVSDLIINIRKLVAGRIDLTIEDEIVARVRVSQEDPKLMEKISFTKNSLSREGLHVAVGKKNPQAKELVENFNKGLAEIKENGTYAKIMEKYGIE